MCGTLAIEELLLLHIKIKKKNIKNSWSSERDRFI